MKEVSVDRDYTQFDLYPTILSAMGYTIKGNKLALGVNLFSDEKTLLEEYGVSKLNEEIGKASNFYNKELLY